MSENNILNSENTTQQAPVQEQASPAETNMGSDVQVSAPAFIETISEDLRAQGNLKDFNDVNGLAKSYLELQRMVGNSVRIPPQDASQEAKQEFYEKIKDVDGVLLQGSEDLYNKLGRPESAENYKFEEIINQDIANNVPSFAEEMNGFKSIAHEIGLTNEQAAKLVQMRMATLEASEENMQLERQQAEAKLHELWGQDFNNRLDAAKQVAKIYNEKYGDEMQALINSPAGNNPVVLNMMAELAAVYQEKGHVGVQNAQFGMTPDMAMQKIADKRADKGFMEAYSDDRHPGHNKAVQELEKLYSIAHNGR